MVEDKDKQYIVVNDSSQLRCPYCYRQLAKGDPGKIEIKCPRCKALCRFETLTTEGGDK